MMKVATLIAFLCLPASTPSAEKPQPATWPELLQRADSLWVAGNYDANILMAQKALAAAEAERGHEDTAVARVCNALGDYYRRAGDYGPAEQALTRALSIRETALGEMHPDVAETYDRFGILYTMEGRPADGEKWHRRAFEIRQHCYHGDDTLTAEACYNVGSSYYFLGRLGDAELHLLRALELYERLRLRDSVAAVPASTRLGQVYCEEWRFEEAESLLVTSLRILEKAGFADCTITARTLDNLASLFRATERTADAAAAYDRAISIIRLREGTEDRLLIGPLLNYADLCALDGKYAKSEQLYRQGLRLAEKWRGESSPSAAYVLLGLAGLLDREHRYDLSEPLYDRIMQIDTAYFGYAHSKISSDREQLSIHLFGSGQPESALLEARKALLGRRTLYVENAWGLSEQAALDYARDMRRSASLYLDLFFQQQTDSPQLRQHAAEAVWLVKGEVTDGVYLRRKYLESQTGDSVTSLLVAYRGVGRQLSELFARGAGSQAGDAYAKRLDSLQERASSLESRLARSSPAFRRERSQRNLDFSRIPVGLPTGSLLAEFLRYDNVLTSPDSVEARYLLMLVDPGGPIGIFDLGPGVIIDSLVEQYQRQIFDLASSGRAISKDDVRLYRKLAGSLYDRLLGPADAAIGKADRLFIAPDGSLSLVSFAGLCRRHQRYLIEDIAVHYLATGRDLLRLSDPIHRSSGLLALGDADFDASPQCRQASTHALSTDSTRVPGDWLSYRGSSADCRQLSERLVTPLPLSRLEVNRVAREWNELTGEQAVVVSGCEASEDRLKLEAPGKRVIHLATHGYFLGGPCLPMASSGPAGRNLSRYETPLLFSGLFLAGANLHGHGAAEAGVEDGILTAEEVAGLSLDATQLVVLSACESGLGEIEQGEGVYGLRHAFQIAGARTVVSALWPVSDASARITTDWLYRHWDRPIFERLRSAQLQELSRLRTQGLPDHPVSWGAFIAQGDWQ